MPYRRVRCAGQRHQRGPWSYVERDGLTSPTWKANTAACTRSLSASLVKDLAHMGLDGGFGDEEVLSDLRVGEAFSHLDEHLALAFGQRVELG